MKQVLSILTAFLLSAFASLATAQSYSPHSHHPYPAYTGDNITLNFVLISYNSCDGIENYTVSRSGNNISLRLNFSEPPVGYYCAQVVTTYDWSASIGAYGPGTYNVTIVDYDTNFYLGSYSFTVLSNVTCQPPSLSQFSATNLGCSSATLTVAVPAPGGYGYRYRVAGTSTWIQSYLTTSNFWPLNNLPSNTTFEYQVLTWCSNSLSSGWSASKYFTTCQSGGNGTCNNPFTAFCGNTYYGNNGSGTNTYNIYTGLGFTFDNMTGAEVIYQVTLSQPGLLKLSLTGLSKDLDLIVLSSCAANTMVAYSGNQYANSEFVSANLPAGTYRIVIDGWNSAVSSYALSVQCSTNLCPAPTASNATATVLSSTDARLVCNYLGASGYDWRFRPLGSANWIDFNASISNTLDLNGLTPNTVYEFQSSVYCSGAWTNWSSSQTFLTFNPFASNDDACNAIELYAGGSCVSVLGSNANATASFYPAAPSCNTTAMRDVWFKVQIPYTGKVAIYTNAGDMKDAVVAFYFGSCNNLVGGNPTCFDDNSNGDQMPDVTVTATPGIWCYIRVWGYNGQSGTFSICAQTLTNLQDGIDGAVVTDGQGGGNDRSETAEIKEAAVGATPMDVALHVFPNPASDRLNISANLAAEGKVSIHIFDLAGKLIQTVNTENTVSGTFTTEVDVKALPEGYYLVKLASNGQEQVAKFIKKN